MMRTLRELWNTADHAGRGRRVSRRRAWLCGLLAASTGCLVTDNTDIQALAAKPQPVALRPPQATEVPFVTDPDCADLIKNERAMRFVSKIVYPDVDEDRLYARLLVNGRPVTNLQLQAPRNGTTLRDPSLAQQCVPHTALSLPCNLVELITTTDLDKLFEGRPAAGALDLDFGVTSWLVLGTSQDQPGATRDDCAALFRDGGV